MNRMRPSTWMAADTAAAAVLLIDALASSSGARTAAAAAASVDRNERREREKGDEMRDVYVDDYAPDFTCAAAAAVA